MRLSNITQSTHPHTDFDIHVNVEDAKYPP